MIVFVPFANIPIPATTVANSSNCLREIIDIRAGNEYEITVPYISSAPYCNTGNGESIGRLSVYLIDAIKVGGTETSDVITVLVEGKGGPDFEVAMRQSDEDVNNYFVFPATLQSGTSMPEASGDIVTTVIGGEPLIPPKKYDYASACIGEAVESIATILKAGGVANAISSGTNISYKFGINPYALLANTITAGVVTKSAYMDPFNLFAPLYCLMRGGLRLSITQSFVATTTPKPFMLSSSFNAVVRGFLVDPADALPDPQLGFYSHNSGVIIKDVTDASVVVDIPQYTKYASSTVFGEIGIASTMFGSGTFETGRKCKLFYSTTVAGGAGYTVELSVHRAVADDFRLGLFISVPPVATV